MLEEGQWGGKIGSGGFSFHDHSDAGAMDAAL